MPDLESGSMLSAKRLCQHDGRSGWESLLQRSPNNARSPRREPPWDSKSRVGVEQTGLVGVTREHQSLEKFASEGNEQSQGYHPLPLRTLQRKTGAHGGSCPISEKWEPEGAACKVLRWLPQGETDTLFPGWLDVCLVMDYYLPPGHWCGT